jgi:hypothetical protein
MRGVARDKAGESRPLDDQRAWSCCALGLGTHNDQIVTTDPTTVYLVGNRLWWSAALFVSPIAGAIAGHPLIAIVTSAVLVLPSFVLFDTDRPWWPDEVKGLAHDKARMRSETRKLTVAALAALLAGIAIAVVGPWA